MESPLQPEAIIKVCNATKALEGDLCLIFWQHAEDRAEVDFQFRRKDSTRLRFSLPYEAFFQKDVSDEVKRAIARR